MRRTRFALSVLACLLLCPGLAGASGFGLFQHGGRATAQAGAFTARASDPTALTYNPAAIARLDGFQFQAGLDFSNPEDQYSSETGSFDSRHIINFPPGVYFTWKLPHGSPYAFGLGLDSPFWSDVNWDPALFPARALTRRFDMELVELHPVIAWEVDDSWSVGGGLRYAFGSLRQGENRRVTFLTPAGTFPIEVVRTADADVDGFGWDLAVHYARPSWGWGAVLRSSIDVDGSGDATYQPRDVPPGVPGLDAQIAARFGGGGSARQAFELPYELRSGIWWAPYPELRLEVDAGLQRWSGLDDTHVSYSPDAVGDSPVVRRRGWDDTLAFRLGLEGEITESFWLQAGYAREPSPVPTGALEPGFPRGDANVYSGGFSYNFPKISFDIGYSFHDHGSRSAPRQEILNPRANGRYTDRDQVWAASVRWRL